MNPERRGLVGSYRPYLAIIAPFLAAFTARNVRATSCFRGRYQTAVRDFTQVLDVVQSNYAEPVDVDKAVYQGAIPGMLRMLDPHSNFFDATAIRAAAGRPAREILRRGHGGCAARQSHRSDVAVRGRACVQRGAAAGRRDYRRWMTSRPTG